MSSAEPPSVTLAGARLIPPPPGAGEERRWRKRQDGAKRKDRFYAEHTDQAPERLIEGSLRIVGADQIWLASRSIGADRAWASMHPPLLSTRRLRLVWRSILLSIKGAIVIVDEDDYDIVAQNLATDRVSDHYREGSCLRLQFAENPLGARVWEGIQRDIPEDVAGNFVPADPCIAVGGHDIWEDAEHERGHLFGRATFSMAIFGYGTPGNWKRYRELIFDVPEVIDLERRLEELAGSMKRCVYWSV